MKKSNLLILSLLIILSVIFYAFIPIEKTPSELKLTVTSKSPSVFSLCLIDPSYPAGRKDLKNLKTPYEIILSSDDLKILCKKESGKENPEYKLTGNKRGGVGANWPVSVFIVYKDHLETFGVE